MAKTKQDAILEAIQGQTKVIGDLASAITSLLQKENNVEVLDEPEVETTVKKRRGRRPVAKKVAPLNKFEQMKDFNAHKADTKIDKKLWKDREPAQRRETNSRIEIKCSQCDKKVKVSPDEIGEDSSYKCNNCIVGKR